jgi:D-alanyl-D-alanine carboxypeptidase (penicillin-binding protein 5/6)
MILRYVFFLFAFLAILAFALVGVQWFSNSVEGIFYSASASSQTTSVMQAALVEGVTSGQFKKITSGVDATAALSVQVSQGQPSVLFEKNSQQELPIASLTKLMTALIVLQHYDVNQVHDLLFSMLIESSNQAAEDLSGVMGQELFVAAMNAQAKDLGMVNTHFADSSGLSPQSVSSAVDIATLTQHLVSYYPLFNHIVALPSYGAMTTTNKLLGQDGIIGGKTGYTNEAKGCFMAIEKTGDDYRIHIVLGADDRFLEMQKLINQP